MQDSTAVPLPSVAILGAGSMGGAILAGIRAATSGAPTDIIVTTRSAAAAAALAEKLDGTEAAASSTSVHSTSVLSTEADPDANREAVRSAELVILAVKPAALLDLAAGIAGATRDGAVVVSVAAGVPISAIEERLPGVAVVRAMPNTPSTIGRGVTGISAGTLSDYRALDLVEAVFSGVGSVHRVPETQLDAVTAVSGSGPAYVFYLVEKLAAAGIDLGLDADLATALAAETFAGAAELLLRSGESPAELRRRVTSPNGTTERAVAVLDDRDVAGALHDATAAAAARSAELSRRFAGAE